MEKIKMSKKTNLTVQDAFELFIRKCRVKNLAEQSIISYRDKVTPFLKFTGNDRLISEIDSDTVDDFIIWLRDNTKANDITINSYLRSVRAFLYYCMNCDYIPRFKIQLTKAEKKLKETYTDEELMRLLAKPDCNAPKPFLYKNNGPKGQILCRVCAARFSLGESRFSSVKLRCPHCGNALVPKKERKHFILHKCVNLRCPYYLHNLKKVDKAGLKEDYGKNKYKLHYIYREFTMDFFSMDLNTLPKNASSLKFSKHNAHVMSLCLTLHVNPGLSLRKTSQALKDLYNISVSRQQIANCCKTAAICIKPFVDQYPYRKDEVFTADETYIKIRGIKTYVWLIVNAATRSIIGCQVSDNRGVGSCILAMRMAFRGLKKLPEKFKFTAGGYNAYPLAAMEFAKKFGKDLAFSVTQVIGLTNDDAVSAEHRPFKQMIERLNRTYKASYRHTNGFDNIGGAGYDLALWVACYNFLRPHKHNNFKVLNEVEMLQGADNMPGKWQLLLFLGQQTILELQKQGTA